jgi:hypothetical protein
MATNPPLDLQLTPLKGKPRPVQAWISMFNMLIVALDPWDSRSRAILATVDRIFATYDQSDCRVAFIVASNASDARRHIGTRVDDVLTFLDADFAAIRAFGLSALPAILHLAQDGSIVNAVEGWDPPAWRALTDELSKVLSWTQPPIPLPTDPKPFAGTPVSA